MSKNTIFTQKRNFKEEARKEVVEMLGWIRKNEKNIEKNFKKFSKNYCVFRINRV